MDLKTSKIGFIGAGNMGGAILEGLLNRRLVQAENVSVYDKFGEKAAIFAQEWGVRAAVSASDLAAASNVIVLAVKPQDLDSAAADIRGTLKKEKILISILAGSSLEKLSSALQAEVTLVRAMPNLGARVAQSLTALTSASMEALDAAEEIFSGCGRTLRLEEKHFDLFTALCGSGPAYFFQLMEAIEAKAVEAGIERSTAGLIASQTALGAALTAQSSELSAGQLREMVTSKGGTTAAALDVMSRAEILKIYSDAFEAASNRSRELRETTA